MMASEVPWDRERESQYLPRRIAPTAVDFEDVVKLWHTYPLARAVEALIVVHDDEDGQCLGTLPKPPCDEL